ncbi:DUF2063 domain-containing protein [Pararhodobacter marinus]|uniref:DUF2063 domain-containing protein n=1 Tax=Pararhodobacter marinus TaxID=2184063 RepID=A0A2U2C8F5_9RHOB|nr:DNA-binding domain-containing protein [Pararhodobacter marinus]PWE28147.1 DUF2063 domain-containing protein [Pararhodobacter marinus]
MRSLPDHAATETAFHAALWSPDTPEGLAPADALDRRVAVYRNNVRHGLTRALAARFPVVERLVGAEFFSAMAGVFAAAHPPATPVLSEWGGDFPAFLSGFPPVAGLPYLPDVARFEALRGHAYHAADAPVADPAALSAGDPARLVLTLAPSVHAFASAHPALRIWQANQPGRAPAPPGSGRDHALIARRPDFAIVTEPLDAGSHAILTALLRGVPLGEAATHDPAPLLALLLRHQLISRIGERP